MPTPDRIEALHQTNAVVGMDFVYVFPDQVTLSVFFHPALSQNAEQILGAIANRQVRIYSPSGGETLAEVPVSSVSWATQDGRRVLRIVTEQPGDFSRYKLAIADTTGRLDPFFNDLDFTFKANCPSDLDCATAKHECPVETPVDFPVNYLARDFHSFRQALIDFASARHPDWKDRLVADQGMMLIETMSALGDEFAYYQDRVAREASLETATQRRSLRRHARLVDYHVHDGLGATTWLDFTVNANGAIAAGVPIWAVTDASEPDAALRLEASRAVFETGHGLGDGHATFITPAATFNVRVAANEFTPYSWDEDQTCLPVGSTSLHITGHHAAALPLEDFTDPDVPGKWVLLRTTPVNAGVPARAWMVRLIVVRNEIDPLFNLPAGQQITYLEWEEGQATPFELEYESLVVRGNLVPSTAGETLRASFQVEPQTPPGLATHEQAVERQGPLLNEPPPRSAEEADDNDDAELSPAFLMGLPDSDERAVIWRGANLDDAAPEVRLFETTGGGSLEWEWKRTFLGTNSSQPSDTHFMLEDGIWRRIAGYRRIDENGAVAEHTHRDYATGKGSTVRFGDGEFGLPPTRGATFNAVYRLGNARRDNVAAGSLTDFNPATLNFVTAVTNPLDVSDAVVPETSEEIRQLAPEAFRAVTYRAVRSEDYAEAVERLDWVQRAGAQFRWTGSWLTLFATPDPENSFELTDAQHRELDAQLNRFRLAGREAYARDPFFVTIDLRINVCIEPASYRGEVEASVLEALFGKTGLRPVVGFFSPDNFTFGTALDRAKLEATIQAVAGVRAVEEISIRRRGWFGWRDFTESAYAVSGDEIIRIENNRLLPERGAVRLITHGGA
ncbi:MAG TPA: hypothetical protein VHO24_13470 [Opitutaceae bacterium]|nr:hypothetical protein [Opitutaceae bacterium]